MAAQLERLHRVLAGHVERRDVPGLAALVSRHDTVHVETLGTLALDGAAPMRRDTLFRIASLTKLATAVAAMILVEECRLRLDDAVDPWLPELADRRVLRSIDAPLDDTVPAARAVTLRDLLTYRTGFGSVMAMPDTYPMQRAIRELQIGGDGPPRPAFGPTMDEWLRRLGSLPWMAQPGERWLYHVSGDLLGALVSRVAGQPLGAFMRERIFEPLGMTDTAFHVPDDAIDRLPPCYFYNNRMHALDVFDDPAASAWREAPPFEQGGGGLVSTLDDWFAFSRMLLNRGRYQDGQILSRPTVALMTSDQLLPGHRAGADVFFGAHSSWGLGMAVALQRDEIYRTPGQFGWTGGTGTIALVDPAEDAIAILFTQRMMDSPAPPRVFTNFLNAAYSAFE